MGVLLRRFRKESVQVEMAPYLPHRQKREKSVRRKEHIHDVHLVCIIDILTVVCYEQLTSLPNMLAARIFGAVGCSRLEP